MEKRAITYAKYLLFSEPMATLRFHLFWGITEIGTQIKTHNSDVLYLLLGFFLMYWIHFKICICMVTVLLKHLADS